MQLASDDSSTFTFTKNKPCAQAGGQKVDQDCPGREWADNEPEKPIILDDSSYSFRTQEKGKHNKHKLSKMTNAAQNGPSLKRRSTGYQTSFETFKSSCSGEDREVVVRHLEK